MSAQQLITEHIDLWTSSIKARNTQGRGSNKKRELYGIKKLRELILGLGLSGLLCDSKGEFPRDIEVLLNDARDKYSNRRSRKLKDYQIGRPIINEFEIPPNWKWMRVAELCDLQTGATPSRQHPEYFGGDIPWLVSGDINRDVIEECDGRITNEGLTASNCKVLPEGTVLIALNGQGKTRATVALMNIAATCNQSLVGMIPLDFSLLDSRFLQLALKYRYFEIRDITGQHQRRGLNMGLVAELSLPLPPIDVQHRIVAKVDELMALCDQLEQQTESSLDAHNLLVDTLLTTLTNARDANKLNDNWARLSEHFDTLITTDYAVEQLKQTILQLAVQGKLVPQDPNDEPASELLKRIAAEKEQLIKDKKIKKQKLLPEITDEEKAFELPKGWEWCRLDELSLHSEAGWSPKCHGNVREDDKWGVLKVSAVTWGKFNPDENKELPDHLEPRPEYEVKENDFLISRANTAELVARSVVVPVDTPSKLMMSDKIIRFSFSEFSSPAYLSLVNNSRGARAYYSAVAGGTSSSMKNVSRKQIQMLLVALPSLAEQVRIMFKVDELMTLCDKLKLQINHAQTTQLHIADAAVEKSLS